MTLTNNQRYCLMGLYTMAMRKLLLINELEDECAALLPPSPLDSEDIKQRVADFLYAVHPAPERAEEAVSGLLELITWDENKLAAAALGEPPPPPPAPFKNGYATLSPTASRALILQAISDERDRQEAKWGEQNHPSVYPQPVPPHCRTASAACRYHEIPNPLRATAICDLRHKEGMGSWADIAVEELSEVVAAAIDGDAACREELVQLGAVCVAWIEAIDRRSAQAEQLETEEEGALH